MSSSFGLLAPESRDLSQAGKEIIVCKAEQIHKMTTIFTQKEPRTIMSEHSCHLVNLQTIIYLPA